VDDLDPMGRADLRALDLEVANDVPDVVTDWLKSVDLTAGHAITLKLARLKDGGIVELLPDFPGRLPGNTEIGRLYGSGRYKTSIEYRPDSWDKNSTSPEKRKDVPGPVIVLGPEFDALHEEYVEEQRTLALGKMQREQEKRQVLSGGRGAGVGIEEIQQVLTMFAPYMRPPERSSVGGELFEKIILALIPTIPAILDKLGNRGNSFDQVLAILTKSHESSVAQIKSSSEAMLEIYKSLAAQKGGDPLDRVLGLLDKTLTVKDRFQRLSGDEGMMENDNSIQPPSFWEKMFTVVGEKIIPQLPALLAIPGMFRKGLVDTALTKEPEAERIVAELRQESSSLRIQAIENAVMRFANRDDAKSVLEVLGIPCSPAEWEAALAKYPTATLAAENKNPASTSDSETVE